MTFKYNSIYIEEIVEFLNSFFTVEQFPEDERGGIYLPSSNPVERLGLALEPGMQLQEWVIEKSLDALFLHRPWKLDVS